MSSEQKEPKAGVDHEAAMHTYDSFRVPTGVEAMLGAFSYGTKRPLKDLHVLDAGCGTGSYIKALSGFVGKVTGLELSEDMIKVAKKKTADLGNVELLQGDVTNMPFPDGHFDAVCCNLVAHHLDSPGTSGHPMIKKFIKEAHRVLKPGGSTLVINEFAPEQRTTMWHFSLFPSFFKDMAEMTPQISVYEEFLSEVGFVQGPISALTELMFRPDTWYDKEWVLCKEWRNMIRAFSMAPDEELEKALEDWKKKIEDGTAEQRLKESDELRKKIGQTTSIAAYKN